MRTSDFDYELPPERIAQRPADRRDGSRLLVLNRSSPELVHGHFPDILAHLRAGDLLVLNNTRVIPARLRGHKVATGGAVELFLLEEESPNVWDALLKAGGRRPRPGERIRLGDGVIEAEVIEERGMGRVRVRLITESPVLDLLDQHGETPLPPYIHSDDPAADRSRYQTVYAQRPGAVAAPTAGLHFTPELLDRARGLGIRTTEITLHVGIGTFRPVQTDDPAQHVMDAERYEVGEEAARAVEETRAAGGRVIAVGSTSVRTLESVARASGRVEAGSGRSDLFIRPGYDFRVIDGMVTNFHLPRSTLLMMVSALAGRDRILAAYRTAVEQGYRFFSYGDAMLIL